jgi:hypothetical protein
MLYFQNLPKDLSETWRLEFTINVARFDGFIAMKIQVVVFWVVAPRSDWEDTNVSGGRAASIFTQNVLRNVGILPYHYMPSQTRNHDVKR